MKRVAPWGASELRPRAQAAGWQQVAGASGWGDSRGQGIPFRAEGSRQSPQGEGLGCIGSGREDRGLEGREQGDRGE